MANVARKARLESLLHREIASCVQQELRDPRLGFVTILRVELTDDLHFAKAYYSVLGADKDRNLTQRALDAARPRVQARYAPALHTRILPTVSFVFDEPTAKHNRLDDLIRKARATDTDGGSQPEPPTTQALPEPKGH